MIVLVIIGTKLLFPFDDVKRYPATNKEPAVQTMNWDVWAQAQRYFDQHERSPDKIGPNNAIHLTDKDVLDMTRRQLDEYMDWYADSWLDTSRGKNSFPITIRKTNVFIVLNHVADMFPTSRARENPNTDVASSASTGQALNTVLHTVMQDLRPRRVVPEEDQHVPRPGSFYRRCRSESNLSGPTRAFYELAAQIAGVSLKTLVRAVSYTESYIARLLVDQRRSEYFGEDMEVDSDAMDELDEGLSDLDMNKA